MRGNVYAVADLHGRYDLFQMIKDFIQPEDKVYVLGDCGDRGPDGWKTIKEVYENPQFIYIKGNHEQLLIEAMYGDKSLCFYNGGESTYKAWKKDGRNKKWISRLQHLPMEKVYINKRGQRIVTCHAGYTPHLGQSPWGDEYLWNREHFNNKWDENFIDTFIIHGHTICPTLSYYLYDDFPVNYNYSDPTIIKYCNGHKIDLDLGSAFTGKVCLLNLDTWEEKYFYSKELYSTYLSELKLKYQHSEREYWI